MSRKTGRDALMQSSIAGRWRPADGSARAVIRPLAGGAVSATDLSSPPDGPCLFTTTRSRGCEALVHNQSPQAATRIAFVHARSVGKDEKAAISSTMAVGLRRRIPWLGQLGHGWARRVRDTSGLARPDQPARRPTPSESIQLVWTATQASTADVRDACSLIRDACDGCVGVRPGWNAEPQLLCGCDACARGLQAEPARRPVGNQSVTIKLSRAPPGPSPSCFPHQSQQPINSTYGHYQSNTQPKCVPNK